jgi:hypothetical protein
VDGGGRRGDDETVVAENGTMAWREREVVALREE